MLIWEKAEPGNAARELALRNTDSFYNRVTDGKEWLTLTDVEKDREEGLEYGADRFILRLNGEDVGVFDYLYRQDKAPWIGFLFLAPSFRQQGLALAALSEYFTRLWKQGYQTCQLGVVEGNEPAHRFWQGLGFEPVRTATLRNGNHADVYERMIDDDFISSLNSRQNG
ncbi:GNAT family N-acetyltransferase [Gorillibacterium timonense]|uniref:GNAT family N-acetyltransferase n=1 Tax=Gorillibacterium timonense TaxID=1689269 RepID=UPI00071C9A31|nr:GNAT family N-acetyltransferase [Gorillibacterium timonense]